MITAIARLKTQDGKGDQFAAVAKEMVAAVQQNEAGRTLTYTLLRSLSDPTQFVFFEQYADDEALSAHGATEHMRAFGGKNRELGLLAGRPEIERFELITSLDA